jgi:endonuclease YncB( thermonuclease family)
VNAVLVRFVLCCSMACTLASFALYAQDSETKPKVTLDFSNDPCGNPLMESQLWSSVRGEVSQVIDGRTLLVTLPHSRHPLRVLVVGVGLENRERAAEQAKELLSQLLLNRPVEIFLNSNWKSAVKKPTETAGVVHVKKSSVGVDDVGLFLLSKGLVRFEQPRPYSMSGYSECQYKRAEAEAQSRRLGIWAQSS